MHFFFMVTSFLLTASGFVIIFVKIGGWSGTANPHPILGCITVGLCLLQALGGLFRPSPAASNRKYFNIGHFAQGNIVHILASKSSQAKTDWFKMGFRLTNFSYWVFTYLFQL